MYSPSGKLKKTLKEHWKTFFYVCGSIHTCNQHGVRTCSQTKNSCWRHVYDWMVTSSAELIAYTGAAVRRLSCLWRHSMLYIGKSFSIRSSFRTATTCHSSRDVESCISHAVSSQIYPWRSLLSNSAITPLWNNSYSYQLNCCPWTVTLYNSGTERL